MRALTKSDIVGAKITTIYAEDKSADDNDCTVIYFTVDRGFSFKMPEPQFLWRTTEISPGIERLSDEVIEDSFKVEGTWPSMKFIRKAPTKIDVVKRIKARTIQGIYCPRLDEALGFYLPDSSLLVFDDGSRCSCVLAAPHGLGATGLHYRTDIDCLPKMDDLVDFFEIPVTHHERE